MLPGVRIGNGCIFGAGAAVSKDIQDCSIVVGVSARVKKVRRQSNREADQKYVN